MMDVAPQGNQRLHNEIAEGQTRGLSVAQAQASEILWLHDRAIAAASTGITIADARQADMPLIFANPMFEQMTGYSAAMVLGRNCRFLQGADTDRRTVTLIHEALAAGAPCRVTLKNYRRDGGLLWIDLSLAPVHDQAGQLTHYIGIQADVTERVGIARGQRLLADAGAILAESLEDEAVLTRVAWLATERIADWCAIDLTDEYGQLRRLVVAHADPAEAPLAATLQEHPALTNEGTPNPDQNADRAILRFSQRGTYLWAQGQGGEHYEGSGQRRLASEVIAPLIARGRRFGTLVCISTRTNRPPYTEADRALIEELARRCALTIDNAELYRQTRDAVNSRDQFVSIASHELRTPVTSAKGYLQLLERQLGQETVDHERLKTYAGRISTGIERLEALIGDLLDASRTQQGRLDLVAAPCDLAAIGQAVFGRFEEQAEREQEHTLIFDAPEPVPGEWDRGRLDQVLTNLLSNALKYSPQGGAVTLRIRSVADGGALVSVSDQGLGIALDEQRHLFTPFMRGAATQGLISGTGLGLYIVRQIVEGHGGTIGVESIPDRGSTFTFTLPARIPG
jgi:PAS domain S-box-containing protein